MSELPPEPTTPDAGVEDDDPPPDQGELPDSDLSTCGDGRAEISDHVLTMCDDNYEAVGLCDDGNVLDGDGCSSTCITELGFRCPRSGGPCERARCGDGARDIHLATPEACDDGNQADGDGCSHSCEREPGPFTCPDGEPCRRWACGDGFTDPNEECDVGNPFASGCSQTCTQPQGVTCKRPSPLPLGSALLDLSRANKQWFQYELPSGKQLHVQASADGTGHLSLGWAASDPCQTLGQTVSAQFWAGSSAEVTLANTSAESAAVVLYVDRSDPQVEKNVLLSAWLGDVLGSAPSERPRCGDGVLGDSEGCDDGNALEGDGCNAQCVREPGFACLGEPSSCETAAAGELWELAESFRDGEYSLSGYRHQPDCSGPSCRASRWWRIEVPPYRSVRVGVEAHSELRGELRLWGAVDNRAVDGRRLRLASVGFGTHAQRLYAKQGLAFLNGSGSPGELFVEVTDLDAGPSSASFSLTHVFAAKGCGDGVRMQSASRNTGSILHRGEHCDDGNRVDGDGCSAGAEVEPGWDCRYGPCVQLDCGDGVVHPLEACDDGNDVDGDGCSTQCAQEPSWLCHGSPSVCEHSLPGDTCEAPNALDAGEYAWTDYLRDPQCRLYRYRPRDPVTAADCDGVDRWFSVRVAPGHTVHVDAATSDQAGYLYLFSAGCPVSVGRYSSTLFAPQAPARRFFSNTEDHDVTVIVAVALPGGAPATGGFSLDYAIRPTGCGDFWVAKEMAERCDDGNLQSGDGCSASCQVEAGHACSTNPSVCVPEQAGDLSTTAEPLQDGSYSLNGFYLRDSWTGLEWISMRDRWFSVVLPAHQLLVLDVASTGLSFTQVEFYDSRSHERIWPEVSGPRRFWLNPSNAPTQLLIALTSEGHPLLPGNFTLAHRVLAPSCGDAYLDLGGRFGAHEACDDGNTADGDGCSGGCELEPGYLCNGEPSACAQ